MMKKEVFTRMHVLAYYHIITAMTHVKKIGRYDGREMFRRSGMTNAMHAVGHCLGMLSTYDCMTINEKTYATSSCLAHW